MKKLLISIVFLALGLISASAEEQDENWTWINPPWVKSITTETGLAQLLAGKDDNGQKYLLVVGRTEVDWPEENERGLIIKASYSLLIAARTDAQKTLGKYLPKEKAFLGFRAYEDAWIPGPKYQEMWVLAKYPVKEFPFEVYPENGEVIPIIIEGETENGEYAYFTYGEAGPAKKKERSAITRAIENAKQNLAKFLGIPKVTAFRIADNGARKDGIKTVLGYAPMTQNEKRP